MKRQPLSLSAVLLGLVVVMAAAGVVLHGLSVDAFERGWLNVIQRPSQSLAFRFILQPFVSCSLAVRDGIRDARTGNSPFFWTLAFDPAQRSARLHEGLSATGKVFLVAIVIDVVYQLVELEAFYPGEAIVIATLLAFIPYLIVRGPVARLVRRAQRPQTVKRRT